MTRSEIPSPSGVLRYRMCERYIESDIPLPELGSGVLDASEEFVDPLRVKAVHRRRFPPPFEVDGVAFFRRRLDGANGSEFIAEDVARITTDGTGSEIVVEHVPEARPATLSHLVVDQAVPRALSERDLMVLHATGVVVDGLGLGFLGSTGTGKSTLAMSFVMDGAELIADDCLAMRNTQHCIEALPSYGSGRLRPDSLAALRLNEQSLPGSPGKRRVIVRRQSSPLPMTALLVLRRDPAAKGPTVQRLPETRALWSVTQHSFASHDLRPEAAMVAMARLTPLVRQLAVYELSYGTGFDALAAVRREVLRVVRIDSGAMALSVGTANNSFQLPR